MVRQIISGQRWGWLLLALPGMVLAGEKVDRQLPAAEVTKVYIENVRGDVRISGWEQPTIRIRGELDDKAHGLIFKSDGRYTEIKVDVPHQLNQGDGSDLQIDVPRHILVKFKGVDTDFELRDLQAGVLGQTVSGSITSANGAKEHQIKSVSGDISLAGARGRVQLETVSGSLSLAGQLQKAKLRSISGDVEVRVDDIDQLKIKTVAGNATVAGEVAEGSKIKVASVNGDLIFKLSEGLDAQCEMASNFGGEIRNRLTADAVERGRGNKQSLAFVVGEGHGRISAKTVNGNIVLESLE